MKAGWRRKTSCRGFGVFANGRDGGWAGLIAWGEQGRMQLSGPPVARSQRARTWKSACETDAPGKPTSPPANSCLMPGILQLRRDGPLQRGCGDIFGRHFPGVRREWTEFPSRRGRRHAVVSSYPPSRHSFRAQMPSNPSTLPRERSPFRPLGESSYLASVLRPVARPKSPKEGPPRLFPARPREKSAPTGPLAWTFLDSDCALTLCLAYLGAETTAELPCAGLALGG
jgi:hypothetical protein